MMTFKITTFKKDLVLQLTAFVLIGFIISIFIFPDNTKTPLNIGEQPQFFLSGNQ